MSNPVAPSLSDLLWGVLPFAGLASLMLLGTLILIGLCGWRVVLGACLAIGVTAWCFMPDCSIGTHCLLTGWMM